MRKTMIIFSVLLFSVLTFARLPDKNLKDVQCDVMEEILDGSGVIHQNHYELQYAAKDYAAKNDITVAIPLQLNSNYIIHLDSYPGPVTAEQEIDLRLATADKTPAQIGAGAFYDTIAIAIGYANTLLSSGTLKTDKGLASGVEISCSALFPIGH